MMLPAILDFEASGLGRGSYPIEVGYILSDSRSGCMLIRPEADWERWDPKAEQLHGIPRSLLLRNGRSAVEVARSLNNALAGLTLYSDAWGNDQSWLALLFDRAGFSALFRLEALRSVLTEAQAQIWQSTRQTVARELALERHRASSDARILQQTYLRTLEQTGAAPLLRKPA